MAIKFKAPVKLAGFKVNQTITGDDVPEYVRLSYNAENPEEPTALEDASIEAIIEGLETENAPGTDEWFADVFSAITEANADDDAAPATDDSVIVGDLLTATRKLQESKALNEEVDAIVDANNKVLTGSVAMYEQIVELLTEEELASIPLPGSDKGNNPDKRKTMRIVSGERKEGTTSVINTLIARMPRIVELDKQIEENKADEGSELTTDQRTLRDNLKGDRTAAVRAYRRALTLVHVANLFANSRFLSFEVTPADKQGKRKQYCCEVTNKNKPKEGRNLTVSKFITLTGVTANTTFAQFLDMLKRKQKNKGPETPAADIPEPDVQAMVPMAAALCHAFEDKAKFAALGTVLAGDTEEVKLAIDTIASLRDRLIALVTVIGPGRVGAIRAELKEATDKREGNERKAA